MIYLSQFLTLPRLALIAGLLTQLNGHVLGAEASRVDVWIGTGSAWPSRGIYHTHLNVETGKLSRPSLVAEVQGPGFLAMHPKETHLYAVGTNDNKDTKI